MSGASIKCYETQGTALRERERLDLFILCQVFAAWRLKNKPGVAAVFVRAAAYLTTRRHRQSNLSSVPVDPRESTAGYINAAVSRRKLDSSDFDNPQQATVSVGFTTVRG